LQNNKNYRILLTENRKTKVKNASKNPLDFINFITFEALISEHKPNTI